MKVLNMNGKKSGFTTTFSAAEVETNRIVETINESERFKIMKVMSTEQKLMEA